MNTEMKSYIKRQLLGKKFQCLTGFVTVCVTLLILGSPGIFFFELLYSLAPQLMLASLVAGVGLFLYRAHIMAFSMLTSAAIFFFHLMPYLFIPGASDEIGPHDLEVAHFNVHIKNSNFDSILRAAQNSDAHLLSFQEVNEVWGEKLYNHLQGQYPHHLVADTFGTQGIAIFSRYPVDGFKILWMEGLPNITGIVKAPVGEVRFIAFHTKTPVTPGGFSRRNAHLAAVSEFVKNVEGPVLAIGDFNIVPWSRYLRDFREDTGLIESRQAYAATYPSGYGPLMIPIDYIFHSPHMRCLEFTTIRNISSDHYGVAGKYAFAVGQ